MKKLILSLCLIAVGFYSFAQSKDSTASKSIHVRGSEAMFPVMTDLATAFNKVTKGPKVVVHADGVGTTLGILSLIEGHCDLTLATRKITASEKEESNRYGKSFVEKTFVREALVIVTNKNNPVYKLTNNQVGAIFAGKITNWHEVGGENNAIRVFIRSNTSGSYIGFKEMFFEGNGLTYSDQALMLKTNHDIKSHISKYNNSISYLGFSSYLVNNKNRDLKALRIGNDPKNTVEVSEENIKSGKYELLRDVYFYYNNTSEETLKEFFGFINSPEGRKIIDENDLIVPTQVAK